MLVGDAMKAEVTLARGQVPASELQSWFACIAIKFSEVGQRTTISAISAVLRAVIQMAWGRGRWLGVITPVAASAPPFALWPDVTPSGDLCFKIYHGPD